MAVEVSVNHEIGRRVGFVLRAITLSMEHEADTNASFWPVWGRSPRRLTTEGRLGHNCAQ